MFVVIINFPRIKEGRDAEFREWFFWSGNQFAGYNGLISRKLLKPLQGGTYAAIVEHDSRETFMAMQNSPEHTEAGKRGHTTGQTSVLIPEERVVFVGDNVYYKSPAFLHEAVPDAWLESLRKIGEMDVDHIVPGHGETCDQSYIEEWTKFLKEWFENVPQAVRKGWSKEESIERIAPPSCCPIPQGDDFIKMMVRMNVSHLYDVFTNMKEN